MKESNSLWNGGQMKKRYDLGTDTRSERLAQRNYKDTVFRLLYRDKSELLGLYNAVNDTQYTDPDELEAAGLENAVYMSMKNDVSCVVDLRLNLYEHQSTVNPNMPLRDLFYVSKLYEKIIQKEKRDLYSGNRIQIPSPRFVVFYNGTEEQPERKILRLSESFYKQTDEINLELTVLQLNINLGYNDDLLEKCRSLHDYMQYVDRVRCYSREMDFQEAVERAVSECIEEGILEEFLRANRGEVIQMSIFEYDEELHMANVREEGKEEGRKEGAAWGRSMLLAGMLERGLSPEEINKLTGETVETIREAGEMQKIEM